MYKAASSIRSLALLLISFPLLGASSCGTAQIPKWEGRIYAGSPAENAVVRRQSGEVIRADDPEFKDFMAMRWTGDDGFEGFYRTYVLGCEKWKPAAKRKGVMTLDQANKKVIEAKRLHHVWGDPEVFR